jgi:ribose transport system permease protein
MTDIGADASAEGLPGRDARRSPMTPAGIARALGGLKLGRFSGIYLWMLFVAVFAIWIPSTFLTATTAQTIAGEQAITVILALGALLTMSAGQFDLSIAQNMGFGSALCVAVMAHGHAIGEAVVLTLGACAALGVLNALLIVKLGIESIIATLGTTSILLAATSIATDDQIVGPAPDRFQSIALHQPLGVPIVVIYALLAALVVWYVLEHTPLGRRLSATGANVETARLSGIPTTRYIVGSLVASGVIAGIAAVLLAAKLGTISPGVGAPYLLPTYAAVFLSTTQLKPGRYNVWGTVIALYLLATGVKGFQLAGGALWITDLFNGVALIGAVGLAVAFQKRQAARAAR